MAACKSHTRFQSCSNITSRVIVDARLAFEIKQGSPITSVFATEDELKGWAKIVLPKSEDLVRKVAEMESKRIGVNFAFIAGGTK